MPVIAVAHIKGKKLLHGSKEILILANVEINYEKDNKI